MGTTLGRASGQELESSEIEREVDVNNGFLLGDQFLPPEIVTHILSYVEPLALVTKGRRVCKAWRDIIDTVVWREKVLREVPGADSNIFKCEELTWVEFAQLCIKKPFGRNLLRNGSGQEGFKHWTIKTTEWGGRKWKLEREPVGCDPFPAGARRCFTTSYDWCSAEQMISMQEHGLTSHFMSNVRPNIHIEEWYAGRFDCGFQYSLKVTLLSFNWSIIDSFVFETQGHTREWAKVEHVFSDYKGTVAFVVFHHKGKDTQFWSGHYGSKMTGAKVFLTLHDRKDL